MITVLRAQGFQFAIYLADHEPPNVHVYGGGGRARIALGDGSNGPPLMNASSMKRSDIRKALRLVLDNQEKLLKIWSEIHG